jgi:hypothetical protein
MRGMQSSDERDAIKGKLTRQHSMRLEAGHRGRPSAHTVEEARVDRTIKEAISIQ